MQVLLAWKCQGLKASEASYRWNHVTATWKNRYQPLVHHGLHLAYAQSGNLFLGLISIPEIFLEWQEFYADQTTAVAWAGIAHNLVDELSPKSCEHLNQRFVAKLDETGDYFLQNLEGRFVVGVLHRPSHTLRVIINNYGLSQCFRTSGQFGIAIGTRIAPLLELVGRPRTPNQRAFARLLVMGACFGGETPFENVVQLEPGMELVLKEQEEGLLTSCYTPLETFFERRKDFGNDYLQIGSAGMTMTVKRQLRHSKIPLMNLTGGMDSRTIVATALALGYRPECDVSGVEYSQDVALAAKVAEAAHLQLHRFYPGEHYADQLEHTLDHWSIWTEGMVSAHIAFARSAFALSPRLSQFYQQYFQSFSGLGGEVGRTIYWGGEMLVNPPTPDDIIATLSRKFADPSLSEEDNDLIREEIYTTVREGTQYRLAGAQLLNYFFWRVQFSQWGGSGLDMQECGRHVFAPLCQPLLTRVFFSMTPEEYLSCAWHLYHLKRVFPALVTLPFLTPPLFSTDLSQSVAAVVRKRLLQIHPALYRLFRAFKDKLSYRSNPTLPVRHRERLGAYFHPYLHTLLFSGHAWWPQVIPYDSGQTIWEQFVNGQEANRLWKLVSIELWAKNFLI